MKQNILENHGPLCALYKPIKTKVRFPVRRGLPGVSAHDPDGIAEHGVAGLGRLGGRYVQVRENTWLDPVAEPAYKYPEGRWFTSSAWGRNACKKKSRRTRSCAIT